MSSEAAVIEVQHLSKVFAMYERPVDRLKQLVSGGRWGRCRPFAALNDVSLTLGRGEVLGIVGRNGAGKSTLLQAICGTLTPSQGQVTVRGRVAALLELGAGFNPEFSGRENVFLNGAVLGLQHADIERLFDSIVDFAGIGDFIEQPVKTYSSGMYVRLAFAIATSVQPDVLVVDEALSVGDGEFARKSFDRIMQLREGGATILFCSHSLFQVEALCERAIWLHQGRIQAQGPAAQVVSAYQEFLDLGEVLPPPATAQATVTPAPPPAPLQARAAAPVPRGHAHWLQIRVNGRAAAEGPVAVHSLRDDLLVEALFASDPALPCPSMAVTLHLPDGRTLASAGAWNDGVQLTRNARGQGVARLRWAALPLLKGRYWVSVYLFCEKGLHLYDQAERCMELQVFQQGLEQGWVHLPHSWSSAPLAAAEAGVEAAPAGAPA